MSLHPLGRAVDNWRPAQFPNAEPLGPIVGSWTEIVGPRVAENSTPLALEGDTLLIGTRSSAWSQQLEFLTPQILEHIYAIAPGSVRRVRFRSGGFRRPRTPRVDSVTPVLRRPPPPPITEPASDLPDAFERLRRRIATARRNAARSCTECGAPLGPEEATCAPCHGEAEKTRRVEIERILFCAPWLSSAELQSIVVDVTPQELEGVRRNLLQRWWFVLERAQRTGRALSTHQRQIASSYVLLHSNLPPERVTPAIVRNLLGDELEAQLSGDEPAK